MTFNELRDGWFLSVFNSHQTELSKRSFHRYLNQIEAMGLDVECSRETGYKYSLVDGSTKEKSVRDWILSSMRMTQLADKLKHNSRVVLEPAPQNTVYLEDILTAAEHSYPLKFHYRTPYGVESDMEIVPAFVRMFHQRWYVIGAKVADQALRTLAFDRISNLEVKKKVHKLSTKTTNLLNPDTYFSGCIGIARMEEVEPLKIRIRAFYPQNNFFDEVPLHESQRKVADGEKGEYSDYELRLRPSFDLRQELLQYGRKVIVLEPEDFRQEMIATLKEMVASYETGRDMMEE